MGSAPHQKSTQRVQPRPLGPPQPRSGSRIGLTGPPQVGGHPYGTPGHCQSFSDTAPNPEVKMALNNTNSIKADLVIPTSASVFSIAASIAGDSVSKIPAMLPTTPLPLNVVASNVMYMYSCSQCEFKTPVEAVFKQHVDSIHLGLPVSSNVILGHGNTATVVANVPPSSVITQPQTIVMPHTGQLIAAAAEGQTTTTIDKLHKCPKCNLLLPSKNQLTLHKRKVHGKVAMAAATGGATPSGPVTYAVVSSPQPAVQPSSSVVASLTGLSQVSQPVSVLAAAAV